MDTPEPRSLFAPARRAPRETVRRQAQAFAEFTPMRELLDAIPGIVVVLNAQRQVVFANQALLRFVGASGEEAVHGQRIGELINCVHAFESEGGCGTSEFCRTCGAAQAIFASQRGRASVKECRIVLRTGGDALDLQVDVRPFTWNDEGFSVAAIVDISHEQRRRALERIFFHDILNIAGALRGFSLVMQEMPLAEAELLLKDVYRLADRLIDEIAAQRDLSDAENSDLSVHPGPMRSRVLLEEIVGLYTRHELGAERSLRLDPGACDVEIVSDRVLIGRVLGNMLKNALEACKPGETVTLGCSADGASITFWVHNPQYIPRPVQLQIFQRSFSTKGAGRGLGTYSIRLLSERYLRGRVSFSTSVKEGTLFRAEYPLVLAG